MNIQLNIKLIDFVIRFGSLAICSPLWTAGALTNCLQFLNI